MAPFTFGVFFASWGATINHKPKLLGRKPKLWSLIASELLRLLGPKIMLRFLGYLEPYRAHSSDLCKRPQPCPGSRHMFSTSRAHARTDPFSTSREKFLLEPKP